MLFNNNKLAFLLYACIGLTTVAAAPTKSDAADIIRRNQYNPAAHRMRYARQAGPSAGVCLSDATCPPNTICTAGSCVVPCPDTQFFNPIARVCVALCDGTGTQSNGGGCICATGSILSPSGTSCTPCGPGQVEAGNGLICLSACVDGVQDLIEGGCSSCDAGLARVEVGGIGVCVEACINLGTLINVQAATGGCASCDPSVIGNVLGANGQCSITCPAGQVPSSTGASCVAECTNGTQDFVNGGCSSCNLLFASVLNNGLNVCVEACVNIAGVLNTQALTGGCASCDPTFLDFVLAPNGQCTLTCDLATEVPSADGRTCVARCANGIQDNVNGGCASCNVLYAPVLNNGLNVCVDACLDVGGIVNTQSLLGGCSACTGTGLFLNAQNQCSACPAGQVKSALGSTCVALCVNGLQNLLAGGCSSCDGGFAQVTLGAIQVCVGI